MIMKFRVAVCLCVLAIFSVTGVALAQSNGSSTATAKAAAAKTTKKSAKSAKQQATPAETAGYTASPAEEEKAKKEFESFSQEYMAKLNSNMANSADKKEVVTKDGKYVARYTEADKSTMQISVDKCNSAKTPFTGTIKYEEHVYESEADSPAAAQKGPFAMVKSTPTTEIFRYTDNHWVY